MRSPINLVFLSPGFAADEEDTTAIPSLQLYFRELKARHPEITFTVMAFQYPFRSGNYEWNGIPVYSAGGKNLKRNRILTWSKILIRMIRLYRKDRVDMVHSFCLTETTLTGLFFRCLTGTPLLATAMGRDVKPENRYLPLLRLFSFGIVLISGFQQGFLAKLKRMKITGTVPFGVEPSYYRDNSGGRGTDVLGVGSLNPVKDYPRFIQVIQIVKLEFPGIRCRIIGEGNEKERIEYLIREYGLEGNIILSGRLDYQKVQEEMASAKVLLHTSSFEGQGLVITEALAAGMYVVSSPVGIAAQPFS